jgi:hypothetical protein
VESMGRGQYLSLKYQTGLIGNKYIDCLATMLSMLTTVPRHLSTLAEASTEAMTQRTGFAIGTAIVWNIFMRKPCKPIGSRNFCPKNMCYEAQNIRKCSMSQGFGMKTLYFMTKMRSMCIKRNAIDHSSYRTRKDSKPAGVAP